MKALQEDTRQKQLQTHQEPHTSATQYLFWKRMPTVLASIFIAIIVYHELHTRNNVKWVIVNIASN